jgi:hypothetical protein
MNKTAFLAIASFFVATPSVALAVTSSGVIKTWVSTTGHDTGTCPISAPCQTFQYAHDQTASGGEIDVKDSGGYGTLVITKSITVMAANGVLALINVPQGGTGIAVNATINDVVTLHGLTINGHGVGQYGIKQTESQQLIIEDSIIQGMSDTGIYATAMTENPFHYLSVARTTIRNNKIGANKTGGQNFEANFIDTTFSHNTTGLVTDGYNTRINHCNIEFNTANGVSNSGFLTVGDSTFMLNGSESFSSSSSFGDNSFSDFGATPSFNSIAKK